jgi:hypothetical protein
MTSRWARYTLLALNGFIAVSAMPGGVLIVSGVDGFPPEWLAGSPFSDYLVPGLILFLVGLCAAAAFFADWLRSPRAGAASFAAGVILVGWIAGELLLLHRNGAATDPRSSVEALYGTIGVIVAGLGAARMSATR